MSDKSNKIFEENYQLPSHYGATNVMLIARDPHWIYAYWEISSGSLDQVRSKIGDSEFNRSSYVLRMYDVTLIDFNGYNANSWFDIDVGKENNNWYVNLWSDNVSYCSDIGLKTSQGEFIPLARSNSVTTQRKDLSARREVIWMEVANGKAQKPVLRQDLTDSFKESNKKKRWNITPEDIKAYYANLMPMLSKVRRIKGRRKVKKRSKSKDVFLKKRPGNRELNKYSVDNLLLFGMNPQQMEKIFVGASAELLKQKVGASENFQGFNAGSSQELVSENKRNFFFEIGTELIVYGRTEPDASVTLCGKEVKLREDGTFTLRFALPDAGNIPLDFIAQSADKIEMRRIITSAHRTKTMYSP